MRPAVVIAFFSLGLWLAGPVLAAPYMPATDETVVQKLNRSVSPEERQRRAVLQRGGPDNLDAAIEGAQQALQQARSLGDPRELGAAQAMLAPWWKLADPPPSVRLVRATILQSQHRFADALKDLDVLVATSAQTPLRQQALLTRAAVHQVQGRLDKVKADCTALLAMSPAAAAGASVEDTTRLYAQACLAEVQTLQGAPREGAETLSRLQSRATRNPWLALLRAEMAQRAGDTAAAEKNFQTASAREPDVYTVAAHADWLLERGDATQALAMLEDAAAEADAIMLRRAIALKRLRDPRAAAVADTLRRRLKEARERGTTLHEREEARLALDVDEQPAEALRLARENWQTQKEPADALLLVRAAMAGNARREAQALIKSLQAAGWHDVRLRQALGTAR